MNYLDDLKNLKLNEKISINKIEWWLLKYDNYYKEIYNNTYSQHLTKINEIDVRLPTFQESSNEDKFLELYEALNRLSRLHKDEPYFRQEILKYNKIKNEEIEIKKWISKNEYFGSEKYVTFFLDYLDYKQNNDEIDLNIYIPSLKEFEIYVDAHYFKNTIKFLEIFNNLYWK